MSDRTYAILGTGALGGYYGGQLARSGKTVHFLLHSDFEHVQKHGLRIDTPGSLDTPGSDQGDGYTLRPDTHDVCFYGSVDDMPAADVVCVCLKTTHNHLLPALLPTPGSGRLKPGGVVLAMQNGLHPERDAAAVVGEDRVAGGLCFLCSNKVGPGHIRFLDYGFIKLGPHPRKPGKAMTALLEKIAQDFRGAGVTCDVVADLVLARWQKLVWNVPYNGLSVVLNKTTDELMTDEGFRGRVVGLMQEVATAALAVDGKVIDDAFIQQMLSNTAKMAPYKTSMMLDYEAGRPMEVEAIVGDPVRAAEGAGHAATLMARLDGELRALAQAELSADHRKLPRFAFGNTPEMADELSRLVCEGKKRATCSSVTWGEPPPQAGDRFVVLDGRGAPVCLIETVSVGQMRFDEVGDDFASAEGEGDGTLAYWQEEHRRFFTSEGVYSPEMPLHCEWFRLVERFPTAD